MSITLKTNDQLGHDFSGGSLINLAKIFEGSIL